MKPPLPLTIRPATPVDIPGIRALAQQAASAAHWSEEEYANLVSTAIVLVAEQEGEICGMVCAKPVAGEWELENIVVAAGILRRGVADALMRELLAAIQPVLQVRAACSLGANLGSSAAPSNIFLEVRESNVPARRLYEKHGFRETARRRNYYQNPPEDAILYARPLE